MATFIVNTETDGINLGGGLMSLREAVFIAQTTAGTDTITFAAGINSITFDTSMSIFNSDFLLIEGDVNGDGLPDVTFNGENLGAPGFSFFRMSEGSTLYLDGVEFSNFESRGAFGTTTDLNGRDSTPLIYNNGGRLQIKDTIFSDITLRAGNGTWGADGDDGLDWPQGRGNNKDGGNGGNGGDGGDAYLFLIRGDASVSLSGVTIEQSVILSSGKGGWGGDGGDGGDAYNGSSFSGIGLDGGDGGDGGVGGYGGDEGDILIVQAEFGDGPVPVRGSATAFGVADLSQKFAASFPAKGGDAGLGGAAGLGGDGFLSDGDDGTPGDPGLFGLDGELGRQLFAPGAPLGSSDMLGTTSVVIRDGTLEGFEGEAFTFVLDRIGDLTGDLVVEYEISGIAAGNPGFGFDADDLQSKSLTGSVILKSGERSTDLVIQTVDDAIGEVATEIFDLRITGTSAVDPASTLEISQSADSERGLLLDLPPLFITGGDVTVAEGERVYVRVERLGTSNFAEIFYEIIPGPGVDENDFVVLGSPAGALSGSVRFLAGTGGGLDIPIDAIIDGLPEGTETFRLVLRYAIASTETGETVEVGQEGLNISITDTTADTIVNLVPVTTNVDEGETISFQLQRTGVSTDELRVAYQIISDTGFDEQDLGVSLPFLTDSINIAPGGTGTVTIDLPTVDDAIFEPDETFTIRVTSVLNVGDFGGGFGLFALGDNVVAIGTSEITGQINESDRPVTVSIEAVTQDVGEGGPITFRVDRDGGTASAFTVGYTLVPGDGFTIEDLVDGASLTGEVSFTAGGQASQLVSIGTRDDRIQEPDEPFSIILGPITQTSGTEALSLAANTEITGKILESDVNASPTGGVVISGSPVQGATVSATTSGLADADGLGFFSYVWQRDGATISGATAKTYETTQDDVGAVLTVIVSYTDGGGVAESVTSEATSPITNRNDDPTGSPLVTGTAIQGATLSADPSNIADLDGLGDFSFSWERDGTPISGATQSTFDLSQTDVGSQIMAVVKYVDGFGKSETVKSTPSPAVLNVNDDPTGAVVIVGSPAAGVELTADTSALADLDSLGAFSYAWQRNGAPIPNATQSTYVATQDDVGAQLNAVVSYVDGGGENESVASAFTAAVTQDNVEATGMPSIVGSFTVGSILTADTSLIQDADGLGPFEYFWLRDGVVISGATGVQYQITADDIGAQLRLGVGFVDGGGTTEGVLSVIYPAVTKLNDAPTGAASIEGQTAVGQTLAVNTSQIADADGLGAFSYVWQRNGAPIAGETGTTYQLSAADLGAQVNVVIRYTDQGGTDETVTSAFTAPITQGSTNTPPTGTAIIGGATTVGQSLTANTAQIADADGLGTFSYVWQRNGTPIQGETGPTYQLGAADLGTQINVVIRYTDQGGTNESVASSFTSPITQVFSNTSPTGSVVIGGQTMVGQTLSASASQIADADGLGIFSYVWQRNGTPIQGETGPTYQLGAADLGTQINVVIRYTDQGGTNESVASSFTSPITQVFSNTPPTGLPIITGDLRFGQTLTVDTSQIADADGLGTFIYTWRRFDLPVPDGNEASYDIAFGDIGSRMTVVVSYTDQGGTFESVASAFSEVVTPTVPNFPVMGSPQIVGIAAVGQTLVADATQISDDDGLGTFFYFWQRDGVTIDGAFGEGAFAARYVVTEEDLGSEISVRVSYTDYNGVLESTDSARTRPVVPASTAESANATGSVQILGDNLIFSGLTADTSSIADPDGIGAFIYSWFSETNVIAGATDSTYFPDQNDLFARIDVIVQFIDGAGNLETIFSTGSTDYIYPAGRTITGTPQGDELFGTAGDDTFNGLAGNDTMYSGYGDDLLRGDAGADTAYYDGNQASYTVTLSPDGIFITDRRPDSSGTDQLVSIEYLDFDTEIYLYPDGPMHLEIFAGPAGLTEEEFFPLIELYVAYFGRAADAIGLNYWGSRFAEGLNLREIAEYFYTSVEAQTLYSGVEEDPVAFVSKVYENVLGRAPDDIGLNFWVNGITNDDNITPAVFILELLGGAKAPTGGASDRAYLQTKTEIGSYFAVHKGMSDSDNGTAAMDLFDGTPAGVAAAVSAIDAYYAAALDPFTGEFLMPLVGVLDDPFAL
jgi:hypothetical protein